MLQKLLAEIGKGGTINPAVLASRLQTSSELVAMMLEDLERRGMLSRLSAQCSSAAACGAGCSASSTCAPRVWILK